MTVQRIFTLLKASLTVAVILHLQHVEAVYRWRPNLSNRRRNSGSSTTSGCWTPRGMMELGQRFYPAGCSRIVCKTISSQPVIEHQFCDTLPRDIPNNCIISDRPWRRYPDCCPKIVCSPGYPNLVDTTYSGSPNEGNRLRHPSIPHGFPAANGDSFPSMTVQDNQKPSNNDHSFITPPPPLRVSTDIIYGSGYSMPYEKTASSPYKKTTSSGSIAEEHLVLINNNQHPRDIWEEEELHYLVTPTDLLNDWYNDALNRYTTTRIPYQYEEDFQDSVTTRSPNGTPYVITYDSSPPPLDESSENSYSFFTNAQDVKTSPLPYLRYNLDFIRPKENVTQDLSSTKTRVDEDGVTKSKVTTKAPYIKPTTYSPHTKYGNRHKSTIAFKPRTTPHPFTTTSKPLVTTPTDSPISPVTKRQKVPLLSATRDHKDSLSYYVRRPTSDKGKRTTRLPWISKNPTTPFERITKRIPTPYPTKKRKSNRKTTVATTTPSSRKTTPNSYQFASPDLDPQDHDLVEFIHTPLDPSALIPGHDGYVASKFDSKKEYSQKENEKENHQRRKRSISDDLSINVSDKSKDNKDEEQKRGRPTFYIPWRENSENNLTIDPESLIASMPAKNSYPPTKFEQAAYILQELANATKPSFHMDSFLDSSSGYSPSEMSVTEIFDEQPSSEKEESSIEKYDLKNAQPEEGSKITEIVHNVNESYSLEGKKGDNISQIEDAESRTLNKEEKISENKDILEGSQILHDKISAKNEDIRDNSTKSDGEESIKSNKKSEGKMNVQIAEVLNEILSVKEANKQIPSTINIPHPATSETTTSTPSVTYATIILTTRYPHTQSGKNTSTSSEISMTENAKPSKVRQLRYQNSQNNDQDGEEGISETQRLSIPIYRRFPNTTHQRIKNPTSFVITNSTVANESKTKKAPNTSTSSNETEDSQGNQRRLPWSPPPTRRNPNRRPSSRTLRTRGQVPFQTYKRRYEDTLDISDDQPENAIGDQAQRSTSPLRTTVSKEKKESPDGLDKDHSPDRTNRTHDQIRRQSVLRFTKKEAKNQFLPGRSIARQSLNPHARTIDSSEFSSEMGSSLNLEQTRDSYYVSEAYNTHTNDPQGVSGRELPDHEFDLYTDNEPKINFGLTHRFDYSPTVPTSATSLSHVSHPLIGGPPSSHNNQYRENKPGATSSVEFHVPQVDFISPPYDKFFENEFDDFPHDDIHHDDHFSNPSFGPLFSSHHRDPYDFSHGTNSEPNYFSNSEENKDLINPFYGNLNSGNDHFLEDPNNTPTFSKPNTPLSETSSHDDPKNVENVRFSLSSTIKPETVTEVTQVHHSALPDIPESIPKSSVVLDTSSQVLPTESQLETMPKKNLPKIFPSLPARRNRPIKPFLDHTAKPHLPSNQAHKIHDRFQTPATLPDPEITQNPISTRHYKEPTESLIPKYLSSQITEAPRFSKGITAAVSSNHSSTRDSVSYKPEDKEVPIAHIQTHRTESKPHAAHTTRLPHRQGGNRGNRLSGPRRRKLRRGRGRPTTVAPITTTTVRSTQPQAHEEKTTSQLVRSNPQDIRQPNTRPASGFTESTRSYRQRGTRRQQLKTPQSQRTSTPSETSTIRGTTSHKPKQSQTETSSSSRRPTVATSSPVTSPPAEVSLRDEADFHQETAFLYPGAWEPQKKAS